MRLEQQMVRDFHVKFGFANQGLPCAAADDRLDMIALALETAAENLKPEAIHQQERGDVRSYRAHLMIEELGELIDAMSAHDRERMADALADLLYVVLGTAVCFCLPAEELFHEVHRSNMTKERTDHRMKNKGDGYSPPDIAGILQRNPLP